MHEEVVPYLARKSREEPKGGGSTDGRGEKLRADPRPDGRTGRTASGRSAAGRNPGEGYGGGRLRGEDAQQERRRRRTEWRGWGWLTKTLRRSIYRPQ